MYHVLRYGVLAWELSRYLTCTCPTPAPGLVPFFFWSTLCCGLAIVFYFTTCVLTKYVEVKVDGGRDGFSEADNRMRSCQDPTGKQSGPVGAATGLNRV